MIITEHAESPFKCDSEQYGLGYYTDRRTERLYFYSSYFKHAMHNRSYAIYRFEIDQVPLTWEYIGEVDVEMNNVCVSPCGRYFWSFGPSRRSTHYSQRALFYQVDILTLKYVEFEIHGLTTEVKNSISSAYFRHCSHGTFIFFMTHINKESSFGRIDLVYHISIDETQKTVQLTPIDLPILATGDSIEYDYGDGPRFHKNWHIGLVEVQNELYFYRLDFDGEIFFINWNSSKSSGNWEKFSIDGDYEPKAWNKDLNTSFNSVRFYLPDGIFYQRNWKEEDTIFYQLDIQPDIRHCKCKELFRTARISIYCQVVFVKRANGSLTFLRNRSGIRSVDYSFYTLIAVNEVPQLKHLAYWTIRQRFKRKVTKPRFHGLLQLSSRIANTFKRTKETPDDKNKVEDDPNWPQKDNFLHVDQQKIILRVGRGPIIHLLKEFFCTK